ncbi:MULTISPECIES: hypothetical protein [Pseudofrankia]|uniref:hypothetical protein n=1 Tax=Pseudofrankia TaxID=2994363 RepID=UPI000234DB1A|nr:MULTISPECIES: hypothetical protein [Pseudofrankia]OHV31774.1 hypothetical protein BCD49_05655 [Pseudofrankia sp. EUN1h]
MTPKEWIIKAGIFVSGAAVAAGAFLVWGPDGDDSTAAGSRELQVDVAHGSFAFDIDDEKQVTVFADNVFVGQVVERVGSRAVDGLEVQFKVKVKENLKGTLPAEVTVNQEGGYDPEQSRLVLFADDLPLSAGGTYIFSTRYNKELGFHTLVPRSGDINVTDLSDSALANAISKRRGVVESVAGVEPPK